MLSEKCMYSRHLDSLIVHHIAGCVKRFLGNSKSYGQQRAQHAQLHPDVSF